MVSNALLSEKHLAAEIAVAFHRPTASVGVHAYEAGHPLGLPACPCIHIGLPDRPRSRLCIWTKHPAPENWQIMALHEAHTAFLDAIIAELRERLTSHNE